jgi:hypothetical protein
MIDIKSIKVYYLNPDSFSQRRTQMETSLSRLGFQFERIPSNSSHELRPVRICEGFIKLAETAIECGEFPFLILEDDSTLIDQLPASVNIPSEAKLIYWGASTWECGGVKKPLALTEYDESYYRLHHSLGCHAILVPNRESADHFININRLSINKLEYSDIWLAVDSEEEMYLTPKDGPYFYQDDAHTKPITCFKWSDLIERGLVKLLSGPSSR